MNVAACVCMSLGVCCINPLHVNKLSVTSDFHIQAAMNMTGQLIPRLAQICSRLCWSVGLLAAKNNKIVKYSSSKAMENPIQPPYT